MFSFQSVAPNEIHWVNTMNKGMYEIEGPGSVDVLQSALDIATGMNLRPERILQSYISLALSLRDTGKNDECVDVLTRGLDYSRNLNIPEPKLHSMLLGHLAGRHHHKKEHELCIKVLDEYFRLNKAEKGTRSANYAELLMSYTECQFQLENYRKMAVAATNMLNFCLKLYGSSHDLTKHARLMIKIARHMMMHGTSKPLMLNAADLPGFDSMAPRRRARW